MPPVSPQGSRGGLITAVVIFTIGFVASTIFAIYYGAALSAAQGDSKKYKDRADQLAIDVSSARYSYLLTAAKKDHNLPEATVLAASEKETDDLAKAVVGYAPATQPSAAVVAAINDAEQKAQTALPDLPPGDPGLIGVTSAVVKYAEGKSAEAATAKQKQEDAAKDYTAQIAHLTDMFTGQEKAAKDAETQLAAAKDEAAKAAQDLAAQIAKDGQVLEKEKVDAHDALTQADVKRAALQQKLDEKLRELDLIRAKLAGLHPPVEDAIVRHPDGMITEVGTDGIVYINLGKHDHIMEGLTFQVYDKREGVPKLGAGLSPDNMPAGEGAVEVQQIGETYSQCRVVKLQPGQHLHAGDPIKNLIYDPNIKYKFFVYGNFDLVNVNRPGLSDVDRDRDKIKGLVAQWGGQVQDETKEEPNINTDFVVMGAEPVVKEYTAEELQDQLKKSERDTQVQALKEYENIREKARTLSIPVMNQDRFLYFIGYYEKFRQ